MRSRTVVDLHFGGNAIDPKPQRHREWHGLLGPSQEEAGRLLQNFIS